MVVIEQVNKEWDCVDTMDAYYTEIRKLEGHFEGIEFQHIPRNNNVAANVLSKLGSRRALVPAGVFVQELRKPSIKLLDPDNLESPSNHQSSAPPRDVLMSEKEDDWRKPFIDFILDQLVLDDKAERERITTRSANYVVIGSDLYRKAASVGILMKCILRSEGLKLLAEIHNGECGCHATSTNLVGKAYQSGFYWPTAVTDAKDLVKRCKGCQFFAKQQHLPAQALRTIPLLTVYIRIKVHMDLQADKSPVVVKGPFFPRVVNARYRICGTMCNARIQSSKARKILLKNQVASNLRYHQENTSNLIY
jgi:hypothetical protein